MLWSPSIFCFGQVLVHSVLLSQPAPRSRSLQPFSWRGSDCPGISLWFPASLPCLRRWRELLKEENSSRSLHGFGLLLITSISNRDGNPSSSHIRISGLHFYNVFPASFSKGKRFVFSKVISDIRILVLCLAYLKWFCSESYLLPSLDFKASY